MILARGEEGIEGPVKDRDSYLKDGSKIAIIGGGPAGCFLQILH